MSKNQEKIRLLWIILQLNQFIVQTFEDLWIKKALIHSRTRA